MLCLKAEFNFAAQSIHTTTPCSVAFPHIIQFYSQNGKFAFLSYHLGKCECVEVGVFLSGRLLYLSRYISGGRCPSAAVAVGVKN